MRYKIDRLAKSSVYVLCCLAHALHRVDMETWIRPLDLDPTTTKFENPECDSFPTSGAHPRKKPSL